MKASNVLLVVLPLLLLSACGNESSETSVVPVAASSSTATVSAYSAATTTLFEISAGSADSGRAVDLTAGQSASGAVDVKKQGAVFAFDGQIGNYNNTADGELAVKLCEGTTCSRGPVQSRNPPTINISRSSLTVLLK